MRGKAKLAFVLVLSVFPCSGADTPHETGTTKITSEDALALLDSLAVEQRKTLSKIKTYEVVFTMTDGRQTVGQYRHIQRIEEAY